MMQSGNLPTNTMVDGYDTAINSKDRKSEEMLVEAVNELKIMNAHFNEWGGTQIEVDNGDN